MRETDNDCHIQYLQICNGLCGHVLLKYWLHCHHDFQWYCSVMSVSISFQKTGINSPYLYKILGINEPLAEIFSIKTLSRAHTGRFKDCHVESKEGGSTDFSATQRTRRPTAGHIAQNRSGSWNRTLPLPDEMSRGLNVNGCNNVNTRFHIIKVFPPAVTEPSVLGHAGHYLTAFWCSEGNLREASALRLADFRGGKERE